jgi:hypothetical protein
VRFVRGAAGTMRILTIRQEEGRALEFKILDNLCRCFLLRIQQADVTENEERHGDETKSLTHEDSLMGGLVFQPLYFCPADTAPEPFSHKYAFCSIKYYRLRFWPVGRRSRYYEQPFRFKRHRHLAYCRAISFESVNADGRYNDPSDPSSTSLALMKKLVSKTL